VKAWVYFYEKDSPVNSKYQRAHLLEVSLLRVIRVIVCKSIMRIADFPDLGLIQFDYFRVDFMQCVGECVIFA
jgi:hypothetical protein